MHESPRTVYWDSCIFLHYIEAVPEWIATLDALVDEASATTHLVIVTSTVLMVEVAYAKAEKTGGLLDPAVEAAIDGLWADRSVVQLIDFDRLVARGARQLMRRSIQAGRSLKPMDAIHLASALRTEVSDFQTMEDRLKQWNDLGFPIQDPWTPRPRLGN